MKKYVVFKVTDWEHFLHTSEGSVEDVNALANQEVDDAEVIRGQDITSGPIFHTYASTLIAMRDLCIIQGVITPKQSDHLLDIADHFHHAAVNAEANLNKRLPD